MSKLIILFIASLIKLYKYFISPLLGGRCRYLPTCSEYFLESLKINGLIKTRNPWKKKYCTDQDNCRNILGILQGGVLFSKSLNSYNKDRKRKKEEI